MIRLTVMHITIVYSFHNIQVKKHGYVNVLCGERIKKENETNRQSTSRPGKKRRQTKRKRSMKYHSDIFA